MTPAGVRVLVESGHTVYVEQGAVKAQDSAMNLSPRRRN